MLVISRSMRLSKPQCGDEIYNPSREGCCDGETFDLQTEVCCNKGNGVAASFADCLSDDRDRDRDGRDRDNDRNDNNDDANIAPGTVLVLRSDDAVDDTEMDTSTVDDVEDNNTDDNNDQTDETDQTQDDNDQTEQRQDDNNDDTNTDDNTDDNDNG